MIVLRICAAGSAIVFCLLATASAAVNPIQNPADPIHNPANTMYNPATRINNPASNIYNPAARLENPNPLSPPTPPVYRPTTVVEPSPVIPPPVIPPPAVQLNKPPQTEVAPSSSPKNYRFRTVGGYIRAANKAFSKDDYREFLSITEDALRRISAGTLKAPAKSRQKLIKYKSLGERLLK